MMPLFAVHISDGALAWPWIAGGWVVLAALVLAATWRLREEMVPRIGVLTAAFFVGSSIHIKLAVLPTSVHLILNGLVGVVLGRRAPIAIAIGLALQYLLVAHGGQTTIGVNGCIVGIPALAAGCCYPLLRQVRLSPFSRGFLLGAGAAAGAVALNFLVLLLGGKEDWSTLAKLVLIAHIPVVLIEGAMLGVMVSYLEKVKPEMLGAGISNQAGKISSNGISH
jgi:cobalt/nickel transport system permease protein